MNRIKVQRPQVNIQEGQRLMIIELRKNNEIGELLIETETTGSWGHICYQDTEPEGICKYSGCSQGEEGDGGANMTQGCIWTPGWQLVEDTGPMAMEQLKKHQPVKWKKMERNKGWNPQVPGWLMRWPGWHVVAQLSHDGYVTEYSTQGLCNVGIANYDMCSGHNLRWDKGGPWGGVRHSQD